MKYRHIIILAIFSPLTLQAGSFASNTYEECITDATNRAPNNISNNTIVDFCANLFAEKKIPSKVTQESVSIVVPPSVLENLSGHAGVRRDKPGQIPPQFSGRLFNNSRWVITSVTVTIYPVEEIVSSEAVKPVDEDTRKALAQSCTPGLTSYAWPEKWSTFEVRPLTEAKFSCPEVYAPEGMNYGWFISSASGFEPERS